MLASATVDDCYNWPTQRPDGSLLLGLETSIILVREPLGI
jgi:hypothetical protein